MKKQYEKPEIKVSEIQSNDVISTSSNISNRLYKAGVKYDNQREVYF